MVAEHRYKDADRTLAGVLKTLEKGDESALLAEALTLQGVVWARLWAFDASINILRRKWEKEFPDQLFDMIYSIYKLPRKHKNKHPQFFAKFIRKYIYTPLLNSRGAILEMLDEKNPTVYVGGGRRYKLFMFLEDEVGMPALRAHIWQIIGIGNAARSKEGFERGFNKAFPQGEDRQYSFWDMDDAFE